MPASLVVLMLFARVKDPVLGLLVLIAYAPLLNLEGYLGDTTLYPSEAVLLTAIGVVGLRRPQALRLGGAAWLALAFGAWVALAALAGAGLTDTVRLAQLLRTAFLAAAAFIVAHEVGRRRTGGALVWIDAAIGAAGIFSLLALGEAAISLGSTAVPRTGSAVGGSELLAIHLTLLLPPGLALVVMGLDRSRATRLLLGLGALALVASYSRSGWLGGWAAILGMGLLAGKVDRRAARRLRWAVAIVLAAGVMAAAGLALVPGALGEYGARLRSIADPATLLADRVREWGRGLATIARHPVFGHPDAPNPYSLALALAAVSGLPCLALFAVLVGAVARQALRALGCTPQVAVPAIGLLGALIGLFVTGMGESSLGARVTPAAMATLGLASGLGSTSERVSR